MIKLSIFKNKYERESFLKAFLLYFLSIAFLLSLVFFFYYKSLVAEKKYSLFLEMKNFSFTFEGEKFNLDIVPKESDSLNFYELLENEREFYMLIPIPDNDTDTLKISYPKESFHKEILSYTRFLGWIYLLFLSFAVIISTLFAFYTTHPLRKAVKILDETIKDIVHDINTPVMSIMVNLKLLKLKYPEDEDLSRLELAVKQLSSIYKNLKTALRESKKINEEVNVRKVIEEELEVLRNLYSDIHIETSLEDVKVLSDKDAVERVIYNILSNAFKHNTTSNGFIRIKLTKKELVVENSSKAIKNPERLFDRFYKESQRGIGLGLSIVKKLCDELGWKVKIETEGGLFRITITFS